MIAQYIPLYISELSGCFTVVRWGISQLLPGIHRPWPSSRCRRHRDTHHPWRHKWISTLGPRYPPPGEAIRGDPRLRKLTVGIEDDSIYIYMHNLCTIHNSIEKYMHTFWKSIFCIIVCIIFCLYFMGNRSCHWGDHLFDGDMMGDSWKSKEFGRHSQHFHSGYCIPEMLSIFGNVPLKNLVTSQSDKWVKHHVTNRHVTLQLVSR